MLNIHLSNFKLPGRTKPYLVIANARHLTSYRHGVLITQMNVKEPRGEINILTL